MLDQSTMMKQNLGVKGVMLHFLVVTRMKSINLMPLIWLIQAIVSLYKVGVTSVIPYGINISSFMTFKLVLEGI
jgi:hypothetical protein